MNYSEWYFDKNIQNEIIKFMFNREFHWGYPKYMQKGQELSKLYRCHRPADFEYLLVNKAKYPEKYWNLFTSVAKYLKGVPLRIRGRLTDEGWYDHYFNFIESFDFFIDIDCKDISEIEWALLSAKKLKKHLDKLKVPYYLRFSGCGFHFLIPDPKTGSYDPKDSNSIYRQYALKAKELNEIISEFIDLKVYDSQRKIKLPYSLSLYDYGSYVCTPINTNNELFSFYIGNYRPENIFNNISNRGQKLFNLTGDSKNLWKK